MSLENSMDRMRVAVDRLRGFPPETADREETARAAMVYAVAAFAEAAFEASMVLRQMRARWAAEAKPEMLYPQTYEGNGTGAP